MVHQLQLVCMVCPFQLLHVPANCSYSVRGNEICWLEFVFLTHYRAGATFSSCRNAYCEITLLRQTVFVLTGIQMNRECRRLTTAQWKRRRGIEGSTGRPTRPAVSSTSASVSSHYCACDQPTNLRRPTASVSSCYTAHNHLVLLQDRYQLYLIICKFLLNRTWPYYCLWEQMGYTRNCVCPTPKSFWSVRGFSLL